MTENENKDVFWIILAATLFLYVVGTVVCCATLSIVITEDSSVKALEQLLGLCIAFFFILVVPSALYGIAVLLTTIRNKIINKIKHYVDVFHYYEKLKADEDKKHLLYNNKSKTKP